jgi:hypothetical protein
VGLFAKKPSKQQKMRAVKVSFDGETKLRSKKGKTGKKAVKPMSFTQWVEHYAKMSGGNPV